MSRIFRISLPGPLLRSGFLASNAAEVVGSLTPSRVDPLLHKQNVFKLSECQARLL